MKVTQEPLRHCMPAPQSVLVRHGPQKPAMQAWVCGQSLGSMQSGGTQEPFWQTRPVPQPTAPPQGTQAPFWQT